MKDTACSSTLKQRLGAWCAGVRKYKYRFLLAFAFMGALIGLCENLGENYPFSPFPMYGNPKPDDVDYYFLTDAAGNPLSTQDYAGITAPQIKKRIGSSIESLRDSFQGDKKVEEKLSAPLRGLLTQLREKKYPAPTSSHPKKIDPALLGEIGRIELEKMRTDGAKKFPALMRWPAGVTLRLGLIETTEKGFREQFRKIAELPDAGPPTTGEHIAKEPGKASEGMFNTMTDFGKFYLPLLGIALLGVLVLRKMSGKAKTWALDGTDRWNVGRLEGLFLRAGLAYVMWQSLQVRVEYSTLPKPAGLAYFEIEWLRNAVLWFGDPEHWAKMLQFVGPLLIWYVIGWGSIIPLTAVTLLQFLARSLYASQGAPHHGHQLIGLIFLAQVIVAWVTVIGRGVRLLRKDSSSPPSWQALGNWSYHWRFIAAPIGAAYFITVVTKLDESNGRWIKNAHYFSGQIVKTHRQNYYNDLNPVYLEGITPVAQDAPDPGNDRYRHNIPPQADWMLKHALLAKIFFTLGFIMEATALFLIFSRSLATIYGILIIAFHLLVLWLMQLTFPLNIEAVWVALVNLPGWLIILLNGRKSAASPRSEPIAAP